MTSAVSLYIHWPFCISKCPYCDFNSHVRESIDDQKWEESLIQELAFMARLAPDRFVRSVFFGGGTPSLMKPRTVERLISAIHAYWPVVPDLEITLEANPGSVDYDRFEGFRSAGVNRVSLGIQSFDPESLRFLGRKHTASEAREALNTARRLFSRYSFDLIYARPQQTVTAWEQELKEALTEAGSHLSLYQLTIEEGTGFHAAEKRGDFIMPDQDICGEMYELTQDIMKDAGLPAYEISNHAAPGFECQHNLVYWRYEDYIGIGPGAHGRFTLNGFKYAAQGIRTPEAWLKAVARQGHGLSSYDPISPSEQGTEALLMGLRVKEGIKAVDFYKKIGIPLEDLLDPQGISYAREADCLEWDGEILRLTPYGQQRLNFVLSRLLRGDLGFFQKTTPFFGALFL